MTKGTAGLTPWNELRVAIAELADAEDYIGYVERSGDPGGLRLARRALGRAKEAVERAADAISPGDANNT